MKRLIVTYELRGELIRAMLNLSSKEEIIPTLLQYHMEFDDSAIRIKKIREFQEQQKVMHVWYCN